MCHWLGTPGCRRDCSQYGHDVFGGEQSDASCFVRHGGLRWWGSSPWCRRVRSGRRCRPLRTALSSSGPWCAKMGSNVLWRTVWLGQQKGRLIRAAHRGWVCPGVGYLNATKSRARPVAECPPLPAVPMISSPAATSGCQHSLHVAISSRIHPNLSTSKPCSLFPVPLIPDPSSTHASLRWIGVKIGSVEIYVYGCDH